jgi:hypothetical protein
MELQNLLYIGPISVLMIAVKGKGKVLPITGHEGPEGE